MRTESFMLWWECSKGPSKLQAPPLLSSFNYSSQQWVWHLQSFRYNRHHPEIPSQPPTARLLPRCPGEWQGPGRVGVHLASTCHSLPQNWGSWCPRHSPAFLVVFFFSCQPHFWSLNRWVKAEKMVKTNGGSWIPVSPAPKCLLRDKRWNPATDDAWRCYFLRISSNKGIGRGSLWYLKPYNLHICHK